MISLVLWYTYSLSRVRLFVTPWTVAYWAPLSLGILRARILEWFAMTSFEGSSHPRNQTQVSRIPDGFFYHLSHQGSPIYSLNNFQICSTVLLTVVNMLYIISLRLIYFLAISLSFDPLHPFCLLPTPTTDSPNLFSISMSLFLLVSSFFIFLRFYIQVRSYGICLYLFDLLTYFT